jgi:HEAT repeat protein
MANRRTRITGTERELQALLASTSDLQTVASRDAIRRALTSTHALVVSRAAEIIRQHELEGLGGDIRDALDRFLTRGADVDPGCRAKLALLDALDASDWPDESPFIAATRIVQKEAAWGSPVDTAANVRARGVLGLARLRWRDLPLIAAELLLDPEEPVRVAAATALAAYGSRESAGALITQLGLPEEEPMVVIACVSALLELTPEWAIAILRRGVCGDRLIDRELASIALGESRRDDALELLIEWISRAILASHREWLLRAIGLHRSERALEFLLERITNGSREEAIATIHALAARRFDSGVIARVRRAASSQDSSIQAAIKEALER